MKLTLAVALAGCSVPDIDLGGKHCPCADGYVCDDATQLCVRGLIDAAVDTGADASPMVHSCLGSDPATTPLLSEPFDSLQKWKIPFGTWSAVGGEAVSTTSDTYTFTYPDQNLGPDYRVVTTVRQVEHTDTASAYEIAFHISAVGDVVHCNWEPNDHHIVFQHTTAGGVSTTVLVEKIATVPAAYNPSTPVTLELLVAGAGATCCIRQVPDAFLKFDALPLTGGPPGIKTWKMSAAYNDFTVY